MFTLLYVDDEPGLLELGQLFLENTGDFKVTTALSADAGLGQLALQDFDAIVSDFQMPGMDGIELLKRVRMSFGSIPFVLFTGRGREEVVIEAINNGVDFYLQKGGDPKAQFAELAHKLRQAVTRHRAESALWESEKRLADIINFLPDATFAIDKDGKVIAWNRAIEEMTGVPAAGILGKGDFEYAVPFYNVRRPILIDLIFEPEEVVAKKYANITRRKDILSADTTLPRPKGVPVTLMGVAGPLYDRQGKVIGAIESIRDITQKKETEAALQEQNMVLARMNQFSLELAAIPSHENIRKFAIKKLVEMTGAVAAWFCDYDAPGHILTISHVEVTPPLLKEATRLLGKLPEEVRTTVSEDLYRKIINSRVLKFSTLTEVSFGEVSPAVSRSIQALVGIDRFYGLAYVIEGNLYGTSVLALKKGQSDPSKELLESFAHIMAVSLSRRSSEERLAASEEKFRTVADYTYGWEYWEAPDRGIVYMSPSCERISGYSAEDFYHIPRLLDSIVDPRDQEVWENHRNEADTTKTALTLDFRIVRKDGGIRWINHICHPVFDTGGRHQGRRASNRDITEKKQAEEKLVSANREYTNLLDQIQDIYYFSDIQGRLVRASRSLATLLGYGDISECIGRSIADDFYFIPSDRAQLLTEINKNGKVTGYEILLKRKDGKPVLIEASSHHSYDPEGNVIGIEGTFRDITERKRVEDELRAANEQLVASDEELRAQYDELAESENRIRLSEARLRYMLGFYENAKKSEKELLDYAIEGAGIVTGSTLGYLAFLNDDESELSMYAWSKNTMAECSMHDKPLIYKTEKTGLWGEAVRQRRAVITNDYAAPNPAKKGYPEGHPHIVRHMNVPVLDDGHIVLVAGVANKPSDYTENDANELLLLMQGLWTILIQKHAGEIKKKRDEELRLLKVSTDSSSDQVFWLDFSGRFLYVNDATCRDYGYTRQEFSSMKIFDLNPDLTREIWAMSVADLRQRKNQVITTRHRRRDGSIMDVEIVTVYVNQDDREYSFAYVRDTSDRKKAERELKAAYEQVTASEEELREQYDALAAVQEDLQKHKQQLEEITSAMPGVAYQFYARPDGSMGVYYISSRAPDVFGIENTPGDFFGQFTGCIDSRDRERFLKSIAEATRDGRPWRYEGRFVKPSGETIWFEGISRPIRRGEELVYNGVLLDITERRQVESALVDSERKYRTLVETADEGIWFVDAVFNTSSANRKMQEIFGYTEQEMTGHPVWDFVPPDDVESMKQELFRRPGGVPGRYERRWVRKDGTIVWCLTSATPLLSPEGEFLGSFGMFTDITERKRAEDTLRESAAKFRAIIDQSFQFIGLMTPDGTLIEANRASLDLAEITESEVINRPFWETPWWSHSLDLRETLKDAVRRAASGETVRFEATHPAADGHLAYIDFSVKPVVDPTGKILYLIPEGRDITERKHTEEALFNSQQMLQLVLDSIPQRVFWKDRNSVYLGCNMPLARDAGYEDPKELIGKDDYDTASKGTADLYRADDRQVMETGQPRINFEEPQIRPDGNQAWLRTTKVPLHNKEGEIIGVLGTYEDITERRRTEDALRESEAKFRELAELLPQIVFEMDRNFRITFVNRQAYSTLGYSPDDIAAGFNALSIIDPSQHERVRENMRKLVKNESFEHIEYTFIRKNGSTMPALIYADPMIKAGELAGFRGIIIDISDRKKTEEALRESEEMFRALVESTSDFIWEVDAAGTYTYVSPQVRQILGYEPEDLVGQTPFDIMPPGETERVAAEYNRCVAARLPIVALENKAVRKDGSVVILETSGVVRSVNDGSYQGYRGIDRDITKRKRAEEALRESEAKLSSILHGSPVLQFVIDRNHQVISWNNALEEYSGIRAADIIGTDQQWRAFYPDKRPVLADLLVDGDTEGITRLYAEKFRKSRYVEGAFEATDFFPRMGCSGVWLSFTAAPLHDEQGAVIGAVETLEDVTERMNAETALKEREEYARTILNTAQAGIILVDATSHQIIDANTKALEMIGLDRDSVISRVCHCFLCPAEEGRCPVTDCGQTVNTSERVLITGAGEHIPVLKTVVPVSISGRNILVESLVDISEQKQSEAAIRETNRKLNLLNSITRHDIRNQLMIAQGYTQMALLTKPDHVVTDFLAKITTAIETIQRQIEFTKAYQELGVHAPVWFLVDEVLSSVRPGNVALKRICTSVEIFADPMIDKVFFNLFDNAMKHGNGVTEVTVGCKERVGGLVITFSDNGCGIPPGEKKKIFEKGYGRNTGLGLFLTREILAITGITIQETGAPGDGAVFEIFIPKGAYRKAQ